MFGVIVINKLTSPWDTAFREITDGNWQRSIAPYKETDKRATYLISNSSVWHDSNLRGARCPPPAHSHSNSCQYRSLVLSSSDCDRADDLT